MNKTRLYSLLSIVLFFIPILFVGLVNYTADPLQVYRAHSEPAYFWNNQRNQNAGKIRNYLPHGGYDSILLGNSVADCFLPPEIARQFGWEKTMKLTVNGGQASEQGFMLEQAIRQANPKHVLWVIRAANFSGQAIEVWHRTQQVPFYLYSDTILDDGMYLFSLDMLTLSRSFLQGVAPGGNWESDLDMLNYWMNIPRVKRYFSFNSDENIQKRISRDSLKRKSVVTDIQRTYPCAEHNIVKVIQKHPEIDFVLAFAPMTLYSFAKRNSAYLESYFGVQKYLVTRLDQLPNVRVFGFEDDDRIVDNLANYRDDMHYHSGVSQYMLEAMAGGRNRLTINNIDAYLQTISSKIVHYEVHNDFNEMIPFALPEERAYWAELLQSRANRRQNQSASSIDTARDASPDLEDQEQDES